MTELLKDMPAPILCALMFFLLLIGLGLVVVLLFVAVRQGRELTFWPLKLGPLPNRHPRSSSTRSQDTTTVSADNVAIYADQIDDIITEYMERKRTAKDLRLVSVAATGALDDYITDHLLLERICRNQCHVRIMFLRPDSEHVRIRHWEDGLGPMDDRPQRTIDNLQQSVDKVRVIHENLDRLHRKYESSSSKDRSSLGSFEVKLLDIVPNMTLFISDQRILWGVYTSAQAGHESPVLEVAKEQGKLFTDLKEHFDHLWHHRATWLLRYSQESRGPKLNEKLLKQLTQEKKGVS